MDISVIIPVYNNGPFVRGLVESLLKQDYRGSYEILIVDDGSTDETETAVKSVRSEKIFYHRQENSGPASARNLGIRKARGKIIAFTDGDCLPERTWLSAINRSFLKGVDAVEGKVVTSGRIFPDSHFIMNQSGGMFLTSNIAFLKSSVRGFDTRYRYPNREDSDVAFGLLSRGKKIVFSKKAVVRHRLLKSSLAGMLKRKLYFQSDVLLFKKFPQLYREKIRFPFERFTPFYIFFALAGAVYPATWFGLPFVAAWEISHRKYSFSVVSYLKFLAAQSVGSFLNLFAVAAGCLRYRINPLKMIF